MNSKATLIAIETIAHRPYRLVMETRRRADGLYAITLVSRATRMISQAIKALKNAGFEEPDIYLDRYGFIRAHYRSLTDGEISLLKHVLRGTFEPRRRHKEVSETSLILA